MHIEDKLEAGSVSLSCPRSRASLGVKISKLWNHLESSCGRCNGFSSLVHECMRRVSKESRAFAKVHDLAGFEFHQPCAGCIGSHRIVREHNLPPADEGPVEWPVSLHRHDPVRDNEAEDL
jgi:hypothetical protein